LLPVLGLELNLPKMHDSPMGDIRVVLHLSDLHFGNKNRYQDQEMQDLAYRCSDAIRRACKGRDVEPQVDCLIVTGDIANTATKQEYAIAATFFASLSGHLGVERKNVVLLPGNHDVSWHRCRVVDNQVACGDLPSEQRKERIASEKMGPFESFVAGFMGGQRTIEATRVDGHDTWIYSIANGAISVAAISTCELETDMVHRGYLSPRHAQALIDRWKCDAPREIRIVAVHHNPVATVPAVVKEWLEVARNRGSLSGDDIERMQSDVVGFEGRELLRRICEECKVHVVLHGHHHATDASTSWNWQSGTSPGQTQVISSGSWGAPDGQLPGYEPNVMQLLFIDANASTLIPVPLRFEPRLVVAGAATVGGFVQDDTGKGGALRIGQLADTGDGSLSAVVVADQRHVEFVKSLRQAYKSRFVRLDLRGLGAIQGGGTGAPIAPALDDVYVELRFGDRPDSIEARRRPLNPQSLLTRLGLSGIARAKKTRRSRRSVPRGLVLVGAAGAGKTTWMRWTFRRLSEMAEVVPFVVELREFARHCDDQRTPVAERNFSAFFSHMLQSLGLEGWKTSIEHLFADATMPRPVLLVDGWDELGDMGDQTREQFTAFLDAHPRAVAVVTSRPYGKSRPAAVERFDEYYIQSLTDGDISSLARRFHRAVHVDRIGEGTIVVAADLFESALRDSDDAKELARNPLLLTMMLFISRDRPLPDRRHRLYDACLDAMLAARPEMKRKEGARLASSQWCPGDPVERRRAAAQLAERIQTRGVSKYRAAERVAIVVLREEAETSLPDSWSASERSGFVEWLIGAAGVLVDRSDGSLSFTHLSFQEFLTAWHLKTSVEGNSERLNAMLSRASQLTWWETIRLFVAMVNDDNPLRIDDIARAMVEDVDGYWMLGAMLADGAGSDREGAFDAWLAALPEAFHVESMASMAECARAWSVCRQLERKERMQSLDWGRVRSLAASMVPLFHEIAGFGRSPEFLESALRKAAAHPATRREYFWLSPGLSAIGWRETMLYAWPSPRVGLGRLLQFFASAGAGRVVLRDVVRRVIEERGRAADIGAPVIADLSRLRFALPVPMSSGLRASLLEELSPFLTGTPVISYMQMLSEALMVGLHSGRLWSERAGVPQRQYRVLYRLFVERKLADTGQMPLGAAMWSSWLDVSGLSAVSLKHAVASVGDILASALVAAVELPMYLSEEQRRGSALERDPIVAAFFAMKSESLRPTRSGSDVLSKVHISAKGFDRTFFYPYLKLLAGRQGAQDVEVMLAHLGDLGTVPSDLHDVFRYVVLGDVLLPTGETVSIDELTDGLSERLPLLREQAQSQSGVGD
jgi:predicted MPP superfamily phosphohydrolase